MKHTDMTCDLIPTHAEDVRAEHIGEGFAVFRNREGRRWVEKGVCTRDGPCREGAVDVLPSNAIYPHIPEMRPCCPISFVELPPCAPNTF